MSLEIDKCLDCEYRNVCSKFKAGISDKVDEIAKAIMKTGYSIDDILKVARKIKQIKI